MINFDTEIIKYTVFFRNIEGFSRNKHCYSIEQVDASCKQIKELGGKVEKIIQTRSVIIYD